jgi:iron(III) transport system permease protein
MEGMVSHRALSWPERSSARRIARPAAALVVLVLATWLPFGSMLWDAARGDVRFPALDDRFWSLSRASLLVAGGTALLAALVGAPVGYLLARVRVPGRAALRALMVIPLLTPPYVTAIGWLHILGRQGPLNRALGALLGSERPAIDPYTPASAAWVLGLNAAPLVGLLTVAALSAANPDLEEDARLHGSAWSTLWYVTLPMAAPAIASGALLAFVLALGEFAVPSFYGVNVYALDAFARFGAFYDFGGGTAAALPMLLLAALAFAGQRWFADQRSGGDAEGAVAEPRLLEAGGWRWLALAGCLLPVALGAVVPLIALGARAPALEDYAFAWRAGWRELLTGVGLASTSATLALAGAVPVAWALARAVSPWQARVGEALTLAPLAIPGTVIGIGMIRLWNREPPMIWVYQGPLIVVLGHVARSLPYAVAALAVAWRSVPVSIEEAARIAGASPVRTARQVLFPLLRPGLVAAWCLAFVVGMTELQVTLLVLPPGWTTLAVRIFTLQHDGQAENVAALCLIQAAATLLPVAAVWALAGRRPVDR